MNPLAIQVGLIAIVISLLTSILNKKIVDQRRMKEIKKRVSDYQKKMVEAKRNNDTAALAQLEQEGKEVNPLLKEMMMSSFKPMLYTFIPLIAALAFLSSTYGSAGNIIEVPLFGLLNWFWWYFLVSIIAGITFEIAYRVWTNKQEHAQKGG